MKNYVSRSYFISIKIFSEIMKTTKRKRQLSEDRNQNLQSNLNTQEIKTSIPLSSIFNRILQDVSKIKNKSAPNKQHLQSQVPCKYHVNNNTDLP